MWSAATICLPFAWISYGWDKGMIKESASWKSFPADLYPGTHGRASKHSLNRPFSFLPGPAIVAIWTFGDESLHCLLGPKRNVSHLRYYIPRILSAIQTCFDTKEFQKTVQSLSHSIVSDDVSLHMYGGLLVHCGETLVIQRAAVILVFLRCGYWEVFEESLHILSPNHMPNPSPGRHLHRMLPFLAWNPFGLSIYMASLTFVVSLEAGSVVDDWQIGFDVGWRVTSPDITMYKTRLDLSAPSLQRAE